MAEALNLKNEIQVGTRSGNGRGFKSLRARHSIPAEDFCSLLRSLPISSPSCNARNESHPIRQEPIFLLEIPSQDGLFRDQRVLEAVNVGLGGEVKVEWNAQHH